MNKRSQSSSKSASESAPIVRCAIYTRKSTEEGLDQDFNSLDAQRESAEAFIESQKNEGWVCLPERFDDGGFTGGNMDRPALKRLMTDAEAGKIDCIVVYKVDRLSRSLMNFAMMMETLEKHNISFVSVTQQFNTTHSMGRLTLNILLSFAQFEREIISERTRDKMTAARKKGKWIGGVPVLGYDIDPRGRRLIVNEEEAFRVRSIYELYLERQSLLSTAQELNRRGWMTKRWITKKGRELGGKVFDKNRLLRLLTNSVYIGKVDFKGEVYNGEHQAIVEDELWLQVQKILCRNGRTGGGSVRNKHGALLKGLLHCVPCEAAMVHASVVKNRTRLYRYYVCSKAQKLGWHSCPTKSIPAMEIEGFVIDRIRCIGQDDDLIKETLNQARCQVNESIEKLEDEQRAVQHELKRLTAKVPKLIGGLTRDFTDQERISTGIADLENKIRLSRQRVEGLSEKIAIKKNELVDEKELALALNKFDPVWDSLTLRERARLMHLLVEQVGYDGEKGTLSLTFRATGIRSLAHEMKVNAA